MCCEVLSSADLLPPPPPPPSLSRLQDMLHGIQQRLNSEKYCSIHKCLPLVLDKWSRIFAACEPALSSLLVGGDRHTYFYSHSPTFLSLSLAVSPPSLHRSGNSNSTGGVWEAIGRVQHPLLAGRGVVFGANAAACHWPGRHGAGLPLCQTRLDHGTGIQLKYNKEHLYWFCQG